jgi:hypothetical protein
MSELEELKASNEENAKWLRNICADLRLHGDVPLTIHDLGNPDGMPNDSRDSGLSLADELWLVANALDGSVDASRQGIRARYEEELSALRAAQPLTREGIDAVILKLAQSSSYMGKQHFAFVDGMNELSDALLDSLSLTSVAKSGLTL